jgi:hypothetical protein
MKQRILQIVTLLFLFAAGFLLSRSSWFRGGTTSGVEGQPAPERTRVKAQSLLSTEAGRRWVNFQPTHWRGYLLQQ